MLKDLTSVLLVIAITCIISGVALAGEGNINWDGNIITATGNGVVSENIKDEAQGNALARRAAIVDAQRRLAEIILGVQIDSKTTVKDLAVESDTIDSSVSGLIKGAQITSDTFTNGMAAVTMQIPINGDGSLGGILGKTLSKIDASQAEGKDSDAVVSYNLADNYITAKGFGFPPAGTTNPAKGIALAKRTAQVDAYRNLGEMVEGVQIDSQSTVTDLVSTNEEINTSLNAFIKGAKVLNEKVNSDGSAVLTVGLPISGPSSLSEVLDKNLTGDFDVSGLLVIDSDLYHKQKKGIIDWGDEMIIAKGIGFSTQTKGKTYSAALARRAALVDAQRNLGEIVRGVAIDSHTSIQDMELKSDVVTSKLEAFVKGFKIVEEKGSAGGGYEVTIVAQILGKDHLFDISLQEEGGDYTPAATVSEGYTGLVVNAAGLDLQPAMCPIIKDSDENEIFGNFTGIDPEYIIKYGIVSYTDSYLGAIANGRAGDNPLIVMAVKAEGDKNKSNIVLKNEDAKNIKAEDAKSVFIKNLRIVIII